MTLHVYAGNYFKITSNTIKNAKIKTGFTSVPLQKCFIFQHNHSINFYFSCLNFEIFIFLTDIFFVSWLIHELLKEPLKNPKEKK